MNVLGKDPDETGSYRIQPPTGPWRFKREVSSGDLLMAVAFIISGLFWGSKIEARQTTSEERIATIQETMKVMASAQVVVDGRQDTASREGLRDIKADLAEIRRILLDRATAK